MDSLESRMDRLTPEQRKEVEDFIDFLPLKNNFSQNSPAVSALSPVLMNAPPVLSPEPSSAASPQPHQVQEMAIHEEPPLPATGTDPAPSSIHEIADSDDGYMDYGKFEQVGTPATDAVKNVKRKIIARESESTSRHLLDWVD